MMIGSGAPASRAVERARPRQFGRMPGWWVQWQQRDLRGGRGWSFYLARRTGVRAGAVRPRRRRCRRRTTPGSARPRSPGDAQALKPPWRHFSEVTIEKKGVIKEYLRSYSVDGRYSLNSLKSTNSRNRDISNSLDDSVLYTGKGSWHNRRTRRTGGALRFVVTRCISCLSRK